MLKKNSTMFLLIILAVLNFAPYYVVIGHFIKFPVVASLLTLPLYIGRKIPFIPLLTIVLQIVHQLITFVGVAIAYIDFPLVLFIIYCIYTLYTFYEFIGMISFLTR